MGKSGSSGVSVATLNQPANLDPNILAARAYPRDTGEALRKIRALALSSPETAAEMAYSRKQGNTEVTGPSVRLAELVAQCWGNIRFDGRVVDVTRSTVVAEGVAIDLETNVAARQEVSRGILTSAGRRYSESMIATTGQAAISVAIRNALFRVVPWPLIRPIYEESMSVAKSSDKPLTERVKAMLDWFKEHGADNGVVLSAVNLTATEDITEDLLLKLKHVANTVRTEGVDARDALGVMSGGQGTVLDAEDFIAEIEKE